MTCEGLMWRARWAAVSRMVPGRTDNVCVRHHKALTKTGPPRQRSARAVRQRSGRFVAWQKVDPPERPLALGEAAADGPQTEGDPQMAPPAKKGYKPHATRAKAASRAKRKAPLSSEEEVETDGDSEESEDSDWDGLAHARASKGAGTGEAAGSQGDCAQGSTHQLRRSSRVRKSCLLAGGSHTQDGEADTASLNAREADADEGQPEANPSKSDRSQEGGEEELYDEPGFQQAAREAEEPANVVEIKGCSSRRKGRR